MYLLYDRVSEMVTLENPVAGEVEFLGPLTNAQSKLKVEHGLTPSQAREAVLQAFFNMGAPVDLDFVKRFA